MEIKDAKPREKLLLAGPSVLSDAELLAIFLRTGVAGKSAIDLAEVLLNKFGGIPQLFLADLKEFTDVCGIGPAKYAQVKAVLELSKRHLATKIRYSTVLENSTDTERYLALRLRDRPAEVFACLFLDHKNRVITYKELFYGTINYATVHPREILRQVIKHNASAVILAHNHPSGDSSPSDADIKLTGNIMNALDYIDVRVLDHIIIGAGETFSMADHDMMS